MRKSLITKRNSIIIALVLAISFFCEIILFNYSNIRDVFIQTEVLHISNVEMSGMKKNNDLTFQTTNSDPQMEWGNINKRVRNIELNLDYQTSAESLLQIFYLNEDDTHFTEEKSIILPANPGTKTYNVNLNETKKIKKIRIDVANQSNIIVDINKITLNNKAPFNFNILRVILISLICSLLYYVSRNFSSLIKHRYLIAIIVLLTLTMAKIHGSSIGLWDQFITNNNPDYVSSTIIGKERGIRGDEYIVHTPWMLSQVKTGFSSINETIRSDGQSMIMLNTPTLSPDLIAKPHLWGYLLFDIERGFAWYWNFKLIALLLLSFEICLFLTRNNVLAFLGAIWIAFSPSIQWWYDTPASVTELVIYAEAAIVSVLFYLTGEDKKIRLLSITGLFASLIGFATQLYPALQVPLGYLVLIFSTLLCLTYKTSIKPSRNECLLIGFCVMYSIFSLAYYMQNSYNALKLLMETDYPGRRISTGGTFEPGYINLGLINWLLPYRETNFKNSSELSAYITFIPLLILSFNKVLHFNKDNKLLIKGLFLYMLFQISWLFVSYPTFFAKISFFSYVPEGRLSNIVLGLTATYITIWLVGGIVKYKPFKTYEIICYSSISAIVYIYSICKTEMLSYVGVKFAILTVLIFAFLSILMLLGNYKLFTITLSLVIGVSGFTVNPIARGLNPIFEKPISKEIIEINKNEPDAKWTAVNSPVNGQLLVALGVKTINSVHFYPDLKLWNRLDDLGNNKEKYNRYAHVYVDLKKSDERFEVVQKDVLKVNLEPSELLKAEVKYILSKGSLSAYKLDLIFHDKENDLYIYKV